MSLRPLPVAFVIGVGAPFDSSFSPLFDVLAV